MTDGQEDATRNGRVDEGESSPSVFTVKIDIRPDRIQPRSQGVIPVAGLTTAAFDATTLNIPTVRFGPAGAGVAHKGHVEDSNDDGRLDLVLHFQTRATGIKCGDGWARLTGTTKAGLAVEGLDSFTTTGCR